MARVAAPPPPPEVSTAPGPCHHCFNRAPSQRTRTTIDSRVIWLCDACYARWTGFIAALKRMREGRLGEVVA